MVYDVTNEQSFYNAKRWMEELWQKAEPDIIIMLVGNKQDLAEKNQAMKRVQTGVAKRFAQENQLLFKEASAVSELNVQESFQNLL